VPVALSLLIVAVGARAGDPPTSTVASVKARGKLVMLCFPHQDNGFISVNLGAGPMPKAGGEKNFQGVDVDIMVGFAQFLGVSLEIRSISVPSYGELIPALLRGDGDVIASSFSVTAERQKVVDF
jgi:ABC-type amino acid transport substrate-binding protein